MPEKHHNIYKRFGPLLFACLMAVTVACRVPIIPTHEGSLGTDSSGSEGFSTVMSVSSSSSGITTRNSYPPTTNSGADPSATATIGMTLPSVTEITTKGQMGTSTKTAKSSTSSQTTIIARITTSAETTTEKPGRPITRANMVAMINEERARIGNNVRVSYGDATLQKIADIRAEEQIRLFGHDRPMPCPGCDYCNGEKDCIATESFWIRAAYGEIYSAGGCALKGLQPEWTVEEFLENIKSAPGHYNQMFKATWTRFAYGQTAWGTAGLNGAYMYFNYGR